MAEFTDEEITHALIKFGKMFSKASVVIEGTIIAIDENTFTCTVQIQSKENGGDINTCFYKVPLKVLKGSQASLIEIPANNSDCLLCFRNNNIQRPQIFSINTCDKILIKIGESVFNINSNGFTLVRTSETGTYGLRQTLFDLCDKLLKSQVLTATGPAVFSPDTITAITKIQLELDNYLPK